MDLAASSHRCFQRKLPIGRGAPVLVEKVLRPQSEPSAAMSVGAMVLSFLNALCREERESPRVLRKAVRPGTGLHPLLPCFAPVRGRPHTSMQARIRELPPLAQKSWRRFCGEGLYASRGWLTDSTLMMARAPEGVKLKAG